MIVTLQVFFRSCRLWDLIDVLTTLLSQLFEKHADNAAAQLADAQSACKECAIAQSGRTEAAEE